MLPIGLAGDILIGAGDAELGGVENGLGGGAGEGPARLVAGASLGVGPADDGLRRAEPAAGRDAAVSGPGLWTELLRHRRIREQ